MSIPININNLNVIASAEKQTSFIPIGDPVKLRGLFDRFFQKNADTSDYWATLGRKDNGQIRGIWSGRIICSIMGNRDFSDRGKLINNEVELLRKLFPDQNPKTISVNDFTITEKFIALDDVEFSNDASARSLRLTVMVNANEQSIVFLQHTAATDTYSQDGVFQYILPEEAEDLGKRDRLTYFFDVPDVIDDNYRFVIKVMTFKRDLQLTADSASIDAWLRSMGNAYGLDLYGNKAFTPIQPKDIDQNKKTLLLIHGTFATIPGSYGDLCAEWFDEVMAAKKYEQIIGFNHPSMFDSPLQNKDKLLSFLQSENIVFQKTVDVITTSRGGLVGKYLVNDHAQKNLIVERVATVACANGVELIGVGKDIAALLSALKMFADDDTAKFILGVLHQGVSYIMSQPGLTIMDKTSPDLNDLLHVQTPANADMRYLPICGDYLWSGNHPIGWKFMDGILTGIMRDEYHDWVVETDFEVIMPDGNYAYQKDGTYYRSLSIDTTHTRYFYDEMTTIAKQRIFYYLHDADDVRLAKNLPAPF